MPRFHYSTSARKIRLDAKPPNYPTHIYFISNGEHIKIGLADDPQKRLRALQTGQSRRLKLLAYFACTDRDAARETERALHNMYAANRQEGEWFDVSEEQILSQLNLMATFVKSVVLVIEGVESQIMIQKSIMIHARACLDRAYDHLVNGNCDDAGDEILLGLSYFKRPPGYMETVREFAQQSPDALKQEAS